MDFDPTSLNADINSIKIAVFGSPNINNPYPGFNDSIDGIRQRLNSVENMVIGSGEPLIMIKQKVDQLYTDSNWIRSMLLAHDVIVKKIADIDLVNIREIVMQLKSIVENLNDIVEDPRFQNELVRMNELIKRIGD